MDLCPIPGELGSNPAKGSAGATLWTSTRARPRCSVRVINRPWSRAAFSPWSRGSWSRPT